MSALRWLVGALAATILLCSGAPLWAQGTYPDRAIKIVSPFPAGAPVDSVARMIADKLDKAWGRPVVAENRPGAAAASWG